MHYVSIWPEFIMWLNLWWLFGDIHTLSSLLRIELRPRRSLSMQTVDGKI